MKNSSKNTKRHLFEVMDKLNLPHKLNENNAPFYKESLIQRAINGGFFTKEEYLQNKAMFDDAAEETMFEYSDWDENDGFGSSDMTFAIKSFLSNAGIETDFIGGKLTRLQEDSSINENMVDPEYSELLEKYAKSYFPDNWENVLDAAIDFVTAKGVSRMSGRSYADKLYREINQKYDPEVQSAAQEIINDAEEENGMMNEEDKWQQDAVKKPGALHKELGIPEDQKIPMSLINKKLADLKDKAKGDKKLSDKELQTLQRLNLAKTFKKQAQNEEQMPGMDNYIERAGLSDQAVKQKVEQMKSKLDQLAAEYDYESLDALAALLLGRKNRLTTMSEHHSPEYAKKVDLMKGKLDFYFDTDHYDIIDKLDQIFNKIYNEKVPETGLELSEGKMK